MKTDNHTPGPWGITLDCMDTFVSSRDGKTICEVAHSRDFTNPASECVANARLIAAAPDLLEALEGLLSYDRVVRPAFRSKPVGATCSMARIDQDALIRLEDNARAAINKAKGV